MRYPYRIRTTDSAVYVLDLHPAEYYIHKLSDEKEMKHIASYGKRGEGPMEFLDAENIRLDTQNRLWTLDANNSKFAIWDSCEQTETSLDPQLIRSLDFTFLDDSSLIIPDYTGENRICIVNNKGELIKKLFSIPDERQQGVSQISLAQAWRSFIDYNPQNGILAVVTQLGQVIEIYDMKKEQHITLINATKGAPQFTEKQNYAIPNGIMGYSDVYVSENTIYALFWGYSFEDIRSAKIKHEGGNRIQTFDLNGNPQKEYIVDRYITGFCIDEANNRLIALDINSDQPIIIYKLDIKHDS
jgi:hypothetical protein